LVTRGGCGKDPATLEDKPKGSLFMLNRRFLGAFALCASLLASVPASALQCVPFARAESGVEIRGNAKTWWSQAAGEYDRGQEPRKGAVMAFAGTRGMPLGHVAVVKKIVSDREILIDHANWSPINGRRGQIERNVRVVDVSDKGDWSLVRVWYAPIGDLGLRANPVQGFIYADGDHKAGGSGRAFEEPVWAQNDWKPGNGLDLVAASLR
jgi:surface antigen